MDSILIDYLRSGTSWVLVGSGPSIQMGYPSWEKLAQIVIAKATAQAAGKGVGNLNAAFTRKDYPMVFEEASNLLGIPQALNVLNEAMVPQRDGAIYKLICKWPVPVYLTTNYDDEIQRHLTNLGESYIPYNNSEDHFAFLVPDLKGAIVKLHGDLRSESGLILTYNHYRNILSDVKWEYWRTKMTSVFQMNKMIVIGHSLTDTNIRHVLEAAKKGAGVIQPICWIAPDVSTNRITEILEKWRIRVISYDNSDGKHHNLLRLLQSVNDFVPSRTKVQIKTSMSRMLVSPLGENAAAPGFFIFNRLIEHLDYNQKRIEVLLAMLQSCLTSFPRDDTFDLITVLRKAGWPSGSHLPLEIRNSIGAAAESMQLIEKVGDRYKVGAKCSMLVAESQRRFAHSKERFKQSLQIRLRREFRSLKPEDIAEIAGDIDTSLAAYFKSGGLSLASTLFSTTPETVPPSILKFINEASARYDDYTKRLAFLKVSVDAFLHSEDAERDYLGRIAQGFFAINALGVFGDVALERAQHASETVWLVDSSIQIPMLCLGAPGNAAFVGCIARLRTIGLRFLTTEALFDETREHLWFANRVIEENGDASHAVIAAAMGEPPYRKANLFLEGFIKWQHAGNPRDWGSYLYEIFRERKPSVDAVKSALTSLGVEVIDVQNWPGFKAEDFAMRDEYVDKVTKARENYLHIQEKYVPYDELIKYQEKSLPEGEVLLIIREEREGRYYMLSERGHKSPSWFISHTSMLNAINGGSRITWQPDAFLDFASTLAPPPPADAADLAFESLLWSMAQSNVTFISDADVQSVFGGTIDQAVVKLEEQKQLYQTTLEKKYGESLSSVIARISPSHKLLAAIQISKEMANAAEDRSAKSDAKAAAEAKRADIAEKKLEKVGHYIQKIEARKRSSKSTPKKNKKSKKKKK